MGLSEGSKARLQLEADFLNTLAGNIAVLGVVAPIISYVFGTALTIDSDLAIGASLVCFAIALALHLTGVARLMRLDK